MNYQKNQEIDSIFYKLNLQDKFTSCLSSWTKALCPYTNEELHNLCYNRTSKISNELNYSHNHFLASYDEPTLNEKETLKSWLLENLLKKSWKSGFGIRPEWTWNNFFKAKKEGASYLDVGPCHGVHSNLQRILQRKLRISCSRYTTSVSSITNIFWNKNEIF